MDKIPEVESLVIFPSSALPQFSLDWTIAGQTPFKEVPVGGYLYKLYGLVIGTPIEFHLTPKLLGLPTPAHINITCKDALHQGQEVGNGSGDCIIPPAKITMKALQGTFTRELGVKFRDRPMSGMFYYIAIASIPPYVGAITAAQSKTIITVYTLWE